MINTQSHNILIVDDDELLREVLEDIIDSLGHKVSVACSGEEAIRSFEKMPYDIVITDLGMEDLSGWEVAEKIKQFNLNTVIILLTGWGGTVQDEAAQSPHIDFLMGKPFHFEEVEETIQKAMAQLAN